MTVPSNAGRLNTLAKKSANTFTTLLAIWKPLPQQLRRIVNAAENGSLQVGMRPEGFEPVLNRVDSIANRIVLGVIAAAFINGLAVLLSVYHPPGLERWAWAAFAFGVGCALLLGTYLAWSIVRPR